MENIIRGKAFVLSDNIDTDQIIPAEHLVYSTSDETELKLYGKFALSAVPSEKSGLPAGNIPFVKENEIKSDYAVIIAGTNFGCGSSREHAPLALQVAGVEAVVAESYARIFYRNAVDGGFVVPVESEIKLNNIIKTGDEVELNLSDNLLTNITASKEFKLKPIGDLFKIVNAGGLFAYARLSGMIEK